MYLFPSLSGQFNDRIPINKNLSFNYGIGIDLPIGLLNFKDGDFGLVMLQSFVFSRLFNVGLSYNL
jgi:hypothetical protein